MVGQEKEDYAELPTKTVKTTLKLKVELGCLPYVQSSNVLFKDLEEKKLTACKELSKKKQIV